MSDFVVKVILGGELFILTLTWILTNPYPLKNYLKSLFSGRVLVSAGFETIMLLQLFEMLNFSLAFLHIWPIQVLGLIVTTLGLIFAVWAKLTMKCNWGVPGQHDIDKQKELVTSGPFAYSRNPIYVGLLIFFFGYELTMGSGLVTLIIPLFYLIQKAIVKEEILLKEYFGEEYVGYMKRVSRFLTSRYLPKSLI